MSKPSEIISTLRAKIAELEDKLENLSDPENEAKRIIASLGGYPRAGIKVVDSDYRPAHRSNEFQYKPGTTVTAPDWDGKYNCGGGLHYSETIRDCFRWISFGADFRAVIVTVPDGDTIIDLENKSKVESLKVVREIDVSGYGGGDAIYRQIQEIRRAIENFEIARRELRAVNKELRNA